MVELAFFSGMTNLEIAEELGQSLEAVEDGVRYAMLQLFVAFKSIGFTAEPMTGSRDDDEDHSLASRKHAPRSTSQTH